MRKISLYFHTGGIMDFKKYLKQIQVRPFVLVALLDFLIDKNHEAFRGKGSVTKLKQDIRRSVAEEYPLEDAVPADLLAIVQESMAQDVSQEP